MVSFFELATRLYEVFGLRANRLCDRDEIGLVSLKKPDQRREERGLAGPCSQLIRPDSGQVEEPPSPPLVAKRCCKRRKRERHRVIVCCALHRLRQRQEV